MDKRTVRKEVQEKRSKLNQRELHKFNKEINSHISVSRLFLEGKVIMGYLAQPDEVSVDASLQTALNMGKTVCVPQILDREGQMQAVRLVTLKKLARDCYGIRTPAEPVEVIQPEDIDLVLVPGAAFTEHGDRLGKGKGFYDRFLPKCTKAVPMGVANEVQVLNELPTQGHDVKIRYLVTEKALRVCK
jgi:5-formyltetrahydrofolate cyclo-ligase